MTIPISQLGQLEYCEYKIYFKDWLKRNKIKPTTVPVSKEIKEGIKAHSKLKEETVEVDTEELMRKRELSVKCDMFRGRMDEIEKTPTYIKIIDDKAHSTPYEGDQLQVWGYCKAYKEQHEDEINGRKIIGCIRNWKTNDIIWKQEFTESENKLVTSKGERILGILDGTITAKSTDNPFKCSKCNLKKTCDKSLYQDPRSFLKINKIKGEQNE